MKPFRIIIAPIVRQQINDQFDYIAKDSLQHALDWEGRLQIAINSIGEISFGFALDEEASERLGYELRKSVFEKTYLIHFMINAELEMIELVNFLHGSRLPQKGEP